MSSAALAYPVKSAEAFRTISEAATELGVPQHVLRFWESRFAQLRPVKRAGGRRFYRPDDIALLKGIQALLYSDGLTIKGVQKVLKERGLRHVVALGRGEHVAAETMVVEKIVYIEKPVATKVIAVKKPRASHLRAVPDTLPLPFFDQPEPVAVVEAQARLADAFVQPAEPDPVIEAVAPEPVVEVQVDIPVCEPVAETVVTTGLDSARRDRLEALLVELTGLKSRLAATRG